MNPWIVLPAIIALSIIYVMLPMGLSTFFHYRRKKLVRCPLAGESVQLQIDARRAGFSAALGHPSLRVTSCSNWPDWSECTQDCLRLPGEELREARQAA